jgi:predicted nucleotidyltransferase component of viral defense system
MDEFAKSNLQDLADAFAATANQRGNLRTELIEKDFWVCWTLKRLFQLKDISSALAFKGGTSLSKVYQAIERFSEDIDLSIERKDLGYGETDKDPATAPSTSQQNKRIERLDEDCQRYVRDTLHPALLASIHTALGTESSPDTWILELDITGHACNILFYYPTVQPRQAEEDAYIKRRVMIEAGARAEQWPLEDKQVIPFVAEAFPQLFTDASAPVKVVSASRTFWEKATILHKWYHFEATKRFTAGLSRHYYDVVQLYRMGIGQAALSDLDMLRRVSLFQTQLFPDKKARFEEAVPGTLRLVPPDHRLREIELDYRRMEEMIFGNVPPMKDILATLAEIEQRINQ